MCPPRKSTQPCGAARCVPGVALVAALLVPSGASAGQAAEGVLVEALDPGSALAGAGVAPGDTLLAWRRDASATSKARAASGRLETPFDTLAVEVEQSSRGPLSVRVEQGCQGQPATPCRSGRRVWLPVPPGDWRLTGAPAFARREREAYAEGTSLLAGGKVDEGIARWRAVAADGNPVLRCWVELRAAHALAGASRWDDWRAVLDAALASPAATRPEVARYTAPMPPRPSRASIS